MYIRKKKSEYFNIKNAFSIIGAFGLLPFFMSQNTMSGKKFLPCLGATEQF
jgi:hypothetical protein